MEIVHINDIDLPGRRFNGHDLQIMLNENGYDAKQFVMNKLGNDPNTIPLINTQGGHFIREKCRQLENNLSLQSMIYPFGELLMKRKEFKDADIVHFHLIFNHFMSVDSFKKIAQKKSVVWTIHDPWALTGHCVHPVDCKGWLTGCHNCPYLERYSPLREDHSNDIWNIKRNIYSKIDIDIIVASEWMLNLVKQSPLTKHFKNVHLIPFGIDIELFKQRDNREKLRKKFGIKKEDFVIMFRQDDQEWKGLPYIKKMLENLGDKKNITLITLGKTGLLEEFKSKYKIFEYEWVNDDQVLVDLYSVADLFLMPSIAESFGLMAVEAMACSLPIIVFEGTALPSVTFAPKCGIALPKDETKLFVQTIERLKLSPDECSERGMEGRRLAEKYYNVNEYNEKMRKLYDEIYSRTK